MVFSACILPALMLSLSCLGMSLCVAGVVRGRRAFAAISCLATMGVAWVAREVLDASDTIVIPMLAFTLVVGAISGRLAAPTRNDPIAVGTIVSGNMFAVLPILGLLLFAMPLRMVDEVNAETASPDRAYTATLYYKDGLTMGFQHIKIRRPGWHLFGVSADVTEVASDGLVGISWTGDRTLAVDYDETKHKDELLDTYFVKCQSQWRDVKIEYRGVPEQRTQTP